MSVYRDSLRADQQAVFDQACREAAQVSADARVERDALAATEGSLEVARRAWFPGHALGSVEAIRQRYKALQDEARQQTHAA